MAGQDAEEWIFTVRKFDTLPEHTAVVNYDGFAEGILAPRLFSEVALPHDVHLLELRTKVLLIIGFVEIAILTLPFALPSSIPGLLTLNLVSQM